MKKLAATLLLLGLAQSGSAQPLLKPEARAQVEARLGTEFLSRQTRYELNLVVDPNKLAYQGVLRLRWTNRTPEPVRVLPLLLHPNAPAELGGGKPAIVLESVAGATWSQVRPTLAEVTLANPVQPGRSAELEIRYHGRLKELPANVNDPFMNAIAAMSNLSGQGHTDYGLAASGDGLITMASCYPMVAPFRQGEFDRSEPSGMGDLAYNEASKFKVRTVLPAGMTMLTNLRDNNPVAFEQGRLVVSEGSLIRDFVLVAGHDLESTTEVVGGTRVTSAYRKADAQAGKRVLEAGKASLIAFEAAFGPYPYSELDLVQSSLTGGAGGMEFSGLVLMAGSLYRDPMDSKSPPGMLLKMWSSAAGNLQGALDGTQPAKEASPNLALSDVLEFTVAHEVAHQYFAGVVGNDSREHPSLDEPLAQYAAGIAMEHLHGPEKAKVMMDQNVKMNYALYRLLGGPDKPVLRPTSEFGSSLEYAALVYGKAPYLYVRLEEKLGRAKLRQAIRETLAKHQFQLTTTEEWLTSLDRAVGGGVTEVAQRWFRESHGDEDLHIDESGTFVLNTMFDPQTAKGLAEAGKLFGIEPKVFLQMMFGGEIQTGYPVKTAFPMKNILSELDKLSEEIGN